MHWPGISGSLQRVNTDAEEHALIRSIQQEHFNRGFIDIGYNHVLLPNWDRRMQSANIYTARGAQYLPAAQGGHNTGTLSICVMIGITDPLIGDVKSRLRSYVRWAEDYTGRELRVRPHRAVNQTECPGDKLAAYVPTLDRV